MEISHLKARQSGLQEEFQKLQHSAQSAAIGPAMLPVTTASSTTTSSSVSSYLPQHSGSHQGFHGDEMDLSDVIWSQQEINRLSTEVMRLEAEVAHWRRMSQVMMETVWWCRGSWTCGHPGKGTVQHFWKFNMRRLRTNTDIDAKY